MTIEIAVVKSAPRTHRSFSIFGTIDKNTPNMIENVAV